MPFIHIKSLPLRQGEDLPRAIKDLADYFSEHTQIEERHVTVTWEFLEPHHYLAGGVAGEWFDPLQHQILVDLLVPDFNASHTVEKMMTTIATALMQSLQLPKESIFINSRYTGSAMVMDAGDILRW